MNLHQEVLLENVIFLDRDGVINRDSPDYIKSWDEFEFLPGSLEALNDLTRAGFQLIVITNQSIVNRGMVPAEALADTHDRMRRAIARTGGRLIDIFYCPHRPDENCRCRKPAPGLIEQACARYGIDPAGSVMIGDSAKDIEAGRTAGCGATVLVRTGNGPAALKELASRNIHPDLVADNLLQASREILAGGLKRKA